MTVVEQRDECTEAFGTHRSHHPLTSTFSPPTVWVIDQIDSTKSYYELDTMAEVLLDAPCPACSERSLYQTVTDLEIPYFHEIISIMLSCSACGFKHNDILITAHRDPLRFRFVIEEENDMAIRLVRSSSGTVRLPELGMMVEPSGSAEAYVTNIEGMLVRFRTALEQAIKFNDDPDAKARGAELLVRLERVRNGESSTELVIEDPLGNSAIISKRARREALSPEEADRLASGVGIGIIDLADIDVDVDADTDTDSDSGADLEHENDHGAGTEDADE